MTSEKVGVSAPGKVLFAGGFLVLDRAHTGLVFGLNARIHVHVQEDSPTNSLPITVNSPQFNNAKWLYSWNKDEGQLNQMTTNSSSTPRANPFVHTALEYALVYLSHLNKSKPTPPLQITILADDSYYSTPPTGQRIGSFSNFGVALHEAHKTGLGSSAALVTSLTAALLVFLGSNLFHDLTDPTTQKRIHNLAQASHCAAQGKVGSGFDVAAAVYGSCLYRRFSTDILSDLGDSHSPGFGERLHRCVEDLNPVQWDVEVSSKAVEIPRSLLLLMCDVDCGSETPGMVKKVLAWRKENPAEALLLWTTLQQGTEDLCRSLTRLAKEEVGGLTMDDQSELSDIIRTIRGMVRDMSAKSQVPIEPPVITELLDYCTGLPGVVGGVAPGAGGYDAVALLVRNDVALIRDLEKRLEGWKTSSEASEGAKIGKVSLLKVQQEWDGVKVENVSRWTSSSQDILVGTSAFDSRAPLRSTTSMNMSDQVDINEDRTIFEHGPPVMLPPDAPEAILLLLVISLGLTITLHTASLTHVLGILVLVLIAKINTITFNPHALSFLSRIHCAGTVSKTCESVTKAHLTGLGEQILAWISGVAPEQTVFEQHGAMNQQFLYRAGIIGAVAIFFLVYKIVYALYVKAYSIASASITELDAKPERGQSDRRQSSTNTANGTKASNRSNPLMSPGEASKQLTPEAHANPLKISEPSESSNTACCGACEALEIAQADWVDAVRQYGEASETVLEENNGLKERVAVLQRQVVELREEVRIHYDRTAYLDVLLEEAGKQLDCGVNVKDMLWKAYSRRQGVPSTDRSSEELPYTDGNAQEVGMASSPPP